MRLPNDIELDRRRQFVIYHNMPYTGLRRGDRR